MSAACTVPTVSWPQLRANLALAIVGFASRDGGASGSIDGSVTLTGRVFHDGFSELTGAQLQQQERDAFIRMVADAEAILVARSDGTDGARQ